MSIRQALVSSVALMLAMVGVVASAASATAVDAGRGQASVTVAGPVPRSGVLGPWYRQAVPSGLGQLDLSGVSCASDGTDCIAAGIQCIGGCGGLIPSEVLSTANGGATWQNRKIPANFGTISAGAVSCPGRLRCLVGGFKGPLGPHATGAFLRTISGGKSWTLVPVRATVLGVSCPTGSVCVAVGDTLSGSAGTVVTTADFGARWIRRAVPAGVSGLNAVTCRSAARCVAFGFSGSGHLLVLVTTDGGTTWRVHVMPSGIGVLNSVACPTASLCIAVGANAKFKAAAIAITSNGGTAWRTPKAPTGVTYLSGVSCATASTCVAVGSAGRQRSIIATRNGGTLWDRASIPSGKGALGAVSCNSAVACIAVGAWFKFTSTGLAGGGPYVLGNRRH